MMQKEVHGMTVKLFCSAILKFVLGAVLVGAMLFLPAGSFDYWNAWLFMAILFIPMFLGGIVLMIKNPDLLKKRLNIKEEENTQRVVVLFSGLIFIAGFVLAGLNFRFGWLYLPGWASWVAAVVFLVAFALYAEVLRENAYLSRTVEVQEGQKVIDSGMYGIVRHPMYAVTTIMFLAIPFVLGSIPSFIVFLLYPVFIAKRIVNEEEVLIRGLSGYDDYKTRVKYRLIPYIW